MAVETTDIARKPDESRYRGAVTTLVVLSVASLVALTNLGYPFVGVGAYVVLFVTALGVWYRYPGRLFDERDDRISAKASDYTVMVFGYGAAVVFPVLTLLYGLGRFEWTEFVAGAGFMLLAVFGVYWVVSGYLYYKQG